jgi:protein-glutamine gamma-glutamyltransferase
MNARPISVNAAWLMLAGLAAGVILHIDRAPLWCSACASLALLWHAMHIQWSVALPGRRIRILVTIAMSVAVGISFRTLGGLAAGSALLLVMGAAKLLETRQTRDAMVVAMVSLVLLLAACLDRQSLLRIPLYAATGWIAIATIAALGTAAPDFSYQRALRTAGHALLLALPLGLLCFVLVPRLPAGLWSLPSSETAQTGLSDTMSPGSISELSVSDAIAFRARFSGAAPAPAQRYWRGPVLHDFDGSTWRRRNGQVALNHKLALANDTVRYEITLAPHGRQYLFALETTQTIEGQRHFASFDGQFLATRAVTNTITYQGTAALNVRYEGTLSKTGRRLDLTLPENRNPRSIELAQGLRAQAGSDAAYAQLVLDYFRNSGFAYSLTPPLLNSDSIDDLLFNTKLGFCGHYASAYVALMRAAGVPARVVTGYLGGEWNAYGGYYVVRQYDAHAWAEIWLDGQGWSRIDPTAVVAPDRLQRGLRDILPDSGSAAGFRNTPWLHDLLDTWDAASMWWQQQVVDFNLAKQLAFFDRLGIPNINYRKLAMMMLGAGAVWLGLVWWSLSRRDRSARPDTIAKLWQRYIAVLQRAGVRSYDHDAPRQLAMRAARQLPDAAASIMAFTNQYTAARFEPSSANLPQITAALSVALRQLARATKARHHPQTAATTPK